MAAPAVARLVWTSLMNASGPDVSLWGAEMQVPRPVVGEVLVGWPLVGFRAGWEEVGDLPFQMCRSTMRERSLSPGAVLA